jgi:hypothetical protein
VHCHLFLGLKPEHPLPRIRNLRVQLPTIPKRIPVADSEASIPAPSAVKASKDLAEVASQERAVWVAAATPSEVGIHSAVLVDGTPLVEEACRAFAAWVDLAAEEWAAAKVAVIKGVAKEGATG